MRNSDFGAILVKSGNGCLRFSSKKNTSESYSDVKIELHDPENLWLDTHLAVIGWEVAILEPFQWKRVMAAWFHVSFVLNTNTRTRICAKSTS